MPFNFQFPSILPQLSTSIHMVNVIPEVELCNKQSIEVNHMIHPNLVE